MTQAALLARASALFRGGGAPGEAIAAYEALLRAHPALPDSWFNLAVLYRRTGRFDAALDAYEQALRHDVRGPEEVLSQQAIILSEDLARPEEARALLLRSVGLAPGHVAGWLNLGNLSEEIGDLDMARDAYARARAADPDDALALARSLGLAGSEPALIDAARSCLARPEAPAQDRLDVGYALGAALDAAADYDAAFAIYDQTNRIARAAAMRQGITYDRAAMEQFVDRSIAAFAEAPMPVDSADAPIFICGMFRSGSTLVEHLLARHPQVAAGGEQDLMPRLSAGFGNDPATIAAAPVDRIDAARQTYRTASGPWREPGRRLTDKRPDNVLHLGLARRMFPGAAVVNTVRHPLDTCLSVFFLHAGAAVPYATDMADIAHYWRQQRRLMRHWRAVFGDVHSVDYDRLVDDPQPVLAALCAACGLDSAIDLMSLPPAAHAVRTASVAQVRKPLYRSSSGRWRHYARHVEPFWGALIEEDRE